MLFFSLFLLCFGLEKDFFSPEEDDELYVTPRPTRCAFKTPSSSGTSIYLTPDGSFMTEINECYQSYEDLENIEINQINQKYNQCNLKSTIEVPHSEQNTSIPAAVLLKRSDSRHSLHRRSITNLILNKFNILSKLSVTTTDTISIEPNTFSENDCVCVDAENDVNEDTVNSALNVKQSVTVPIVVVNCDKNNSFSGNSSNNSNKMASSSPIMSSASVFDKGLFNIARVKKVELQDLSPKVSDLTRKFN